MAFVQVNSLRILSVAAKGDLEHERVVLKVINEIDLVNYLVLDSTYNIDGTISEKNRHVFWFPYWSVSAGDYVLLYTKKGTARTIVDKDSKTIHVFYWGLGRTVWNEDGDVVTIVHTSRFAFRKT